MSSGTTYNLSSVYRALGFRDPRAIPSIAAAQLVPTINLGSFETFAPQVIEARGFFNTGPHLLAAGTWYAAMQFSTSPGGTVFEDLLNTDGAIFSIAPNKPFSGGFTTPFVIGGQPIISIFEESGPQGGAFPIGSGLGGTNTPQGILGAAQRNVLTNLWVAPGSYFWIVFIGTGAGTHFASWRFREIPEPQGAA